MFKFKRLIFLVLILSFVIPANLMSVYAENFVVITENNTTAKVTQIIDGDSIKVSLKNGEVALVKIIGINSQGYDNAVAYLTNRILGAEVTLVKDNSVQTPIGVWNYLYVIHGGLNMSTELISRGYAVPDASQATATFYSDMMYNQSAAKAYGLELWGYGTNTSSTIDNSNYLGTNTLVGTEIININTATTDQLRDELYSVTNALAENIVKYRSHNPFNHVSELVFVEGMTASIYSQNKGRMVVCTNIVKADKDELKTLSNLSNDEIEDIIAYRKKNNLTDINDLRYEKLVSENKFKNIQRFISVSDTSRIDDYTGTSNYNLNTATVYDLKSKMGISHEDAERIVASRANGYTMKHIMEVSKIPDVTISERDLNYVEDNLHPLTDVNTATQTELRSIFSDSDSIKIINNRWINDVSKVGTIIGVNEYEKHKDLIYAGNNHNTYININTATIEQMQAVGFRADTATKITQKTPMKCGRDIPVDVSSLNSKITLYTDINTASEAELRSLNNGINDTIINEIIRNRNEQPFGNMRDVKDLFDRLNATMTYNNLNQYIIVR